MTTFIWAVLILQAIGLASTLFLIGIGEHVERKPRDMALSAVVQIGFIVWAAVLLFSTGANQ